MLGPRGRRAGSRVRVRCRARARSPGSIHRPVSSDALRAGGGRRRHGHAQRRAFGPDGALYVTCSGEDDRPEIVRIAPGGGDANAGPTAVPAYPNGCLVTPDGGALVVVEAKAERVVRVPIAADGSAGEPETSPSCPTPTRTGSRSTPRRTIGSRSTGPTASCGSRPRARWRLVVDDHLASHARRAHEHRWSASRSRPRGGRQRRRDDAVDRRPRRGRAPPALPGGAVMARSPTVVCRHRRAPRGSVAGSCEAFLDEGARVFAADVRDDGLEQTRALSAGPGRRPTPVDLADFDGGEGDGARGDRSISVACTRW